MAFHGEARLCEVYRTIGHRPYNYRQSRVRVDVAVGTTPGLLLAGGGTDQDAAMKWMISRAGGGDFVVIRASGTAAYDPYIYRELGGVNSCETILLQNRAASYDPLTLSKIAGAEALFIAGGNQWDCVRLWEGTPVEDAIHQAAARGVPVGGTSSGLAVLGEFAFSAKLGTITSQQSLHNPYHPNVTLTRDFLHLPFLRAVVTDSHFVTSDRMGRLVTFLARILEDGWTTNPRAIGVDEKTALAVDEEGVGTAFGEGAIYFLEAREIPEVCCSESELTFRDVSVYRIHGAGSQFDLSTWEGQGGTRYQLSAVDGVLVSTRPGGSIY